MKMRHLSDRISAITILTLACCSLVIGYILLFSGCAKDDSPGKKDLDTEAIDKIFSGFTPEYNLTDEGTTLLGHSACVMAAGYEPWKAFNGMADSLGDEVITNNSLFRVGSSTKMFTATLVLQLYEEGLIGLDTPFNHYLGFDEESFPTIGEFSNVTIRHLLSHRSGIPRISSTTFFDHYYYTDPITQLERMKFLFTDGHPEFEPGTEYGYRNSNFNILGLVIERVSGKQYHEVLQERITIPLGLENTFLLDYDITPEDPRFAHGYTQGFEGTMYHGSQAWAGGGLVSTPADLAVFMKSLVAGDLFLQPSTFSMMVTPVAGSNYGFGIFLTQTSEGQAYGHGGAIFGYNTRLEYFPEVEAVVVSTMSFTGYDFIVVNWYDDFCYPVIREVRRAGR